ncbi:response regulator transcription factor [Nitratifractor sp.]
MRRRLFLLEDDIELGETLVQFLREEGFEVTHAFDALEARDRLYEGSFDLWLLDVKVPFQSGIELLESLREEGETTPAIFITSLHGAEDAMRGFEAGADDYIRKPFALQELRARIEAVLKRRYGSSKRFVELGEGLRFDGEELTLYRGEERLPLKPKEARLLALLLQHRGRTVSRERIFETLWDYGETPSEGSLRTYIKVLRRHLGRERIETVKEVGYRYVSL